MAIDELTVADGRRARRARNRVAVVDAMFEQLEEGVVVPSTAAIAAGAGVSVSSLFRYFDSLDDLHQATIDLYFDRFAPLFEIPSMGHGALDDRIDRLVDSRLQLYRRIAPIARLARARSLEHPRIEETLAVARGAFADQIRRHFADELGELTDARADDVTAVVDSLTAFESWDLLRGVHGRTDHQIRRAWTAALRTLLVR